MGWRSEAVGEAREVARRRAAASLRTPPRTRSTGGELSASARHLATFHRLSADRRITPAPTASPAVFAASLCACVRCRACELWLLCRSSFDERLYRDMCVESCVRCTGARRCSSTSLYAIYKVLTVGKVYIDLPEHHLYIGADRGSPTSDYAQPVISSVAPSFAVPDRTARANTSTPSLRVKTRCQSVS